MEWEALVSDLLFNKRCEELTKDIENSYQEGVTLEAAEKLAGKFLHAQLQVAEQLQNIDLDTRMKKSGVKAIRAAVYMQEATKGEKKPSDTYLQALVDMDQLVVDAQRSLDEADVQLDRLKNFFNVFKEAHIHFRGIAKGRFE